MKETAKIKITPMKALIGIIGVCIGIIAIYILYVLLSYSRIEDNQALEIYNKGTVKEEELSLNTDYTAVTYNIGFGAYSWDYSFFMDGGKHARGFNKQAILDNTYGSIQLMKEQQADFLFLQEVDIKATRSYHVNQEQMIQEAFFDVSYAFAINYDSAYLFYPILEPHGKSKAGIQTISDYKLTEGIRRSFPIDTSFYKFMDLDRCYSKTRAKVEEGKELVLYNVHLSAYTKDETIVRNQVMMLSEDMKEEYEKGNYILCGGDFNQDLLGNSPEIFKTPESEENWAKPFPASLLPKGIKVAFELLDKEARWQLSPSCRNADSPYEKNVSFVTMVDGFLVSDNMKLVDIQTVDNGFLYSDHNPVKITFQLGSNTMTK